MSDLKERRQQLEARARELAEARDAFLRDVGHPKTNGQRAQWTMLANARRRVEDLLEQLDLEERIARFKANAEQERRAGAEDRAREYLDEAGHLAERLARLSTEVTEPTRGDAHAGGAT